ncbi:MAG: ATP-binding protein [Lentimicrobium sp.]|jgi:signal transduction histidine kinase/CheY-like chemotaxis protein/AraC-like DNA-binding protein|nr:ATP-binding protein [Lentimicrobium sp.]
MQKFVILTVVILLISSCSSPVIQTEEDLAYQKELSTKLYKIRSEDSLRIRLQQFTGAKDDFGKMLCYKYIGLRQRESSRFSDAINSHQQGLDIALQLDDTTEIVQAMNNLGTDFRRIGAHGEASQYHYQALHYAEAWSGLNTPAGMKNRVVSLNGIGNVSLMLGYYDEAEKHFREALKDEVALKSPIGQAINYANLGAIFEYRQQYDSAYSYFQKSLEQNKIGKSDMGISLCLIHLGELYEKEQKYALAKAEYQKAFDLMDQISDKWHWLEACLSIARIHLVTGNIAEFNRYIELAESTANQIKSPEHLAAVYMLKHDYDITQGNYQAALRHYKLHKEMQDSVQGVQKANRYMDIRLGYEQNKNMLSLQQMEAASKMEQQKKQYVIYMSWIIILVSFILTALLYYAYRQRTRSNILLKKLEQTRTDFFTNITHEFRTPLTVIQGLNRQMQQKKNLSEKEKSVYMAAIDRQSNNLLNLVNQLLEVVKLKRGADEPQWMCGDIVGYLQMTAETFRLYAGEKDVSLVFYSDISANEMDFIPSYIDKIVSNLLSNAIKHTDAGGKIDFVVSMGARPDNITIRIADTGEGIPQEDMERIFDFFYQSPQAKNNSGTGIGLAFTQLMIEKMKGKIEVESQLGKGSVFTINLPLKNRQLLHIVPLKETVKPVSVLPEKHDIISQNEVQPELLEKEPCSVQPLVLIVEDNRDITLYLKSLLVDRFNVITAKNGEEGLEMAEKSIPDLVITDLMMPVKDGYQLACEMKQNMLINHIPVIMLTAKTSEEDRIKGLRCGVEAYIRKPFQPEELLIRIDNIFESRRILKEKYMSAIIRNGSENKLDSDANLKFLQTITNFIHSEMDNPEMNSAFLADKMAMSISQLSRKINGITGYSTISYVLQLKLNKAKKMLTDENISITEVSDACGFYDVSYFSRVFKKEFGISPSHYQKMPTLV